MKQKNISFEAAMNELEDILAKMSDSKITLDDSIELYARAAELLNLSNQKLNTASVKVREIEEKIAEMGAGDDI